jgi:hypothetical protein
MKDLIYHKFHNSSIGGYFVRNGEGASEPIDEYSASAEMQGWLDGVISSSKVGIVTVRFEEDNDKQRAIKETIDEPCDDSLIMIPVHGWIWQRFKEAYAKRNKNDPKTDEDLIENSLMRIAHDWVCRAMQYYTDQGIEDPWTIMEAYEIAMNCPEIRIKREHGIWTIETPHTFDAEAKNATELLRKVRGAREYIDASEALKQEPRPHRSTRDNVSEAMEIAKSIHGIFIWQVEGSKTSGPTWLVSIHPTEFCETAHGSEQLLEKVKEAKDYYEALQDLEKKERADTKRKAVRLDEDEEEREEDDVICLDRLDQSAKRLLIHFIENLTIGEAMCILAESNVYPHIALGDLYGMNIQLRESLGKGVVGNE